MQNASKLINEVYIVQQNIKLYLWIAQYCKILRGSGHLKTNALGIF